MWKSFYWREIKRILNLILFGSFYFYGKCQHVLAEHSFAAVLVLSPSFSLPPPSPVCFSPPVFLDKPRDLHSVLVIIFIYFTADVSQLTYKFSLDFALSPLQPGALKYWLQSERCLFVLETGGLNIARDCPCQRWDKALGNQKERLGKGVNHFCRFAPLCWKGTESHCLASHLENSETPQCFKCEEYMWFVSLFVTGIGRTSFFSIFNISLCHQVLVNWTRCILQVQTGWDEKLQHREPNNPGPALIYTIANS